MCVSNPRACSIIYASTTAILSCDIYWSVVFFVVVTKLTWFREHVDDGKDSYSYGEVLKLIEE